MRMIVRRRSGDRLETDFARDVRQKLTPEALRAVPEAGIEILKAAAAREVATKAKRPTGKLEASVTSRSYASYVGAGAFVGWAETKVNRSQGRRAPRGTYVDGKGQTRYTGSGRRVRRDRRTTFAYTDSRGRGRRVDTVADYAGILEYSQSRQLRHIGPAWNANMDAAVDAMERRLNELLDSAGL